MSNRLPGRQAGTDKIAFVSQPRDAVSATDAQSGSVTTVMWELATRMSRQHEIVVIAPRAAGQPIDETSRFGPRIHRIPLVWRTLHKALDLGTGTLNLRTPYFASRAYFHEYGVGVSRWLEREQPDIVHLQNCTQFLPLFHRAVPQARLFLHVHDEFLSLLPDEVVRPRVQNLTAVVTCSEFVTSRLRARLPYLASRIHTVGNGVDTSYFQAADQPADPEKFRILYVGRVSPEKGVHTLMEAFTRLAVADEKIELDVVGPSGLLPFNQIKLLSHDPYVAALQRFYGSGPWSRLDKQVLHNRSSYRRSLQRILPEPIRARVRFHGQLCRKKVRSAYQQAHVLALPSVCMEPFGLPLAEAMASGLPCVASKAGGIPEILVDKETGLLIERGDVDALTQALQRLARDSATREEMGRMGRRRAEQCLDWSVAAERLDALYRA